MAAARMLHPEHSWGHHYELPQVSDRQVRNLLRKIARALPSAAAAKDETARRSVVAAVWPGLMECASAMNGTPTPRCLRYVSAGDGIETASQILGHEESGNRLFLAYWRLWWTAGSRLGRPVQTGLIADETLDEASAAQALQRLTELAYVAHYGPDELRGTDLEAGFAAFIDCDGCQKWRADRRAGRV
jgi:hypothetical protein